MRWQYPSIFHLYPFVAGNLLCDLSGVWSRQPPASLERTKSFLQTQPKQLGSSWRKKKLVKTTKTQQFAVRAATLQDLTLLLHVLATVRQLLLTLSLSPIPIRVARSSKNQVSLNIIHQRHTTSSSCLQVRPVTVHHRRADTASGGERGPDRPMAS